MKLDLTDAAPAALEIALLAEADGPLSRKIEEVYEAAVPLRRHAVAELAGD